MEGSTPIVAMSSDTLPRPAWAPPTPLPPAPVPLSQVDDLVVAPSFKSGAGGTCNNGRFSTEGSARFTNVGVERESPYTNNNKQHMQVKHGGGAHRPHAHPHPHPHPH